MNDYSSESPKSRGTHNTWKFSPPEEMPQDVDREAHWKHFDTSVNAVSFGFVATAILISMFLVMAIFERFLRPRPSFSTVHNTGNRALVRAQMQLLDKLDQSSDVSSYTIGVSVVMPGQEIPTFIAHPVPLPCPREGVARPCHERGYYLASCSLLKYMIYKFSSDKLFSMAITMVCICKSPFLSLIANKSPVVITALNIFLNINLEN